MPKNKWAMAGKVLLWLTVSITAVLGGISFGVVTSSVRMGISPEKTTELVRGLKLEGNTCHGLHVTKNLNFKCAGAMKGLVVQRAQDRMRWRGAFLIKSMYQGQLLMMFFGGKLEKQLQGNFSSFVHKKWGRNHIKTALGTSYGGVEIRQTPDWSCDRKKKTQMRLGRCRW